MMQKRKRKSYDTLGATDSQIANEVLRWADAKQPVTWVPELKLWRAWSAESGVWVDDPTGAYVRTAVIEDYIAHLNLNPANEAAEKHRNRYLSAVKIANVEQRMRDKHNASSRAFDANPELLNTLTGTLNINTLEEHAPDPNDYLTNLLEVNYQPHVKPGHWARWLATRIPSPNDRRALQVIMGYSALVQGNPERLIVWVQGPTSSGKSTLLEALGEVLGPLARTFSASILQGKRGESARPDLMAVFHKRFIYCTETSKAQQMHADIIKMLVGNDRLSARNMYQSEISEKPHFTPVIATNSIPTIIGADRALERRWVAIRFMDSLAREREVKDLGRKLAEKCGSEIFGWLLKGYQMYQAGHIGRAIKQLSVASSETFAESSQFATYLREHTVESAGHVVTNDEAYTHFLEHAEDHASKIVFGREMTALGWAAFRNMSTRGRVGRALVR